MLIFVWFVAFAFLVLGRFVCLMVLPLGFSFVWDWYNTRKWWFLGFWVFFGFGCFWFVCFGVDVGYVCDAVAGWYYCGFWYCGMMFWCTFSAGNGVFLVFLLIFWRF